MKNPELMKVRPGILMKGFELQFPMPLPLHGEIKEENYDSFWKKIPLELLIKIIQCRDMNSMLNLLYRHPELWDVKSNCMSNDLLNKILDSTDSYPILNLLSNNPQLYLQHDDSMPRDLLEKVLGLEKYPFHILETLIKYPQLWKDIPQDILDSILKLTIPNRVTPSARVTPGEILKTIAENPHLWQEGKNCMPKSLFNKILKLNDFDKIRKKLDKYRYPQLWLTGNGWRQHALFNADVNELIQFLEGNSDSIKILKGLEICNERLVRQI